MNPSSLKKRLQRDRPMTSVTIRMPEDVIDDLKAVAPQLGFSGYQPLIRAYVGQGLRKDMEKLEATEMSALIEGLKKRGVSAKVIRGALADASAETRHNKAIQPAGEDASG